MPKLFARVLAAVFCTSLSVMLLGADAPDFGTPATLVVFPFTQDSGLDPSAGKTFVSMLVDSLNKLGGLKVVVPDPATPPSDYLKVTKASHGDYYLMGHIAPPLNGTVPVLEELISARSGTIVWAVTAQITQNDDMVNQAPIIKQAVVQHSSRGYLALFNPTPSPAPPKPKPTATPKASAAARARSGDKAPEDLPNEAYGFSSKPTAPPKVYASAAHPTRFVVLAISGDKGVSADVRDYAENALIASLKRHGETVAEGDPSDTQFPIVRGPDICQATGASYLVFGNIGGTTRGKNLDDNYTAWTEAQFKPGVFDCGAKKYSQAPKPTRGNAVLWSKAIDAAVDSAVSGYVLKVAASRTRTS